MGRQTKCFILGNRKTIIEYCRELISKDKTKNALEELKKIIESEDGNSLISIESSLSRLGKKNVKGTISAHEYDIEMNRINNRLLELVNKVEQSIHISNEDYVNYKDDLPKYLSKIGDDLLSRIEVYLISQENVINVDRCDKKEMLILAYRYFDSRIKQLLESHQFFANIRSISSTNNKMRFSKALRDLVKDVNSFMQVLEKSNNEGSLLYKKVNKLHSEILIVKELYAKIIQNETNKKSDLEALIKVNVPYMKVSIEKLLLETRRLKDLSRIEFLN